MVALRALAEVTASFEAAEVLVLCYHRVRSRGRLGDQWAAPGEGGSSVLSLPQFTAWLNGAPLPSRPAALLTFDHCYADQLENTLPVLDSLKFPATFFPASAVLAREHPDVAAHWRKTLLELAQSGYSIGCHSHLHQDLTKLSMAELLREVVVSKQILEDILGQRVSAFCYPYGAYDARVKEVVQEAGFDVAFTVDLGGVSSGDDSYSLKRVPVLGEPSSAEFGIYLSW